MFERQLFDPRPGNFGKLVPSFFEKDKIDRALPKKASLWI